MFTVSKTFSFEAAHQLVKGCFTNKCSDCIHGHSYKVTLFLRAPMLDVNGMVCDFGLLSQFISGVMETWDHAVLLPTVIANHYRSVISPSVLQKLVDFQQNPTAENIARKLFDLLHDYCLLKGLPCYPSAVRVMETENCGAIYTSEDE